MEESRRKWRVSPAFLIFVGLLAGGYAFARTQLPHVFADSTNYEILFPRPPEWERVQHTPFALFLYEHPETRAQLRGAQNQVVSDYNPTPDMDTSGIADYYVTTTNLYQPDWRATRLLDMRTATERFSAIRRERKDKIVVTAFSVKGNTTALFSLSISDPHLGRYDELMSEFKAFLGDVRIERGKGED